MLRLDIGWLFWPPDGPGLTRSTLTFSFNVDLQLYMRCLTCFTDNRWHSFAARQKQAAELHLETSVPSST